MKAAKDERQIYLDGVGYVEVSSIHSLRLMVNDRTTIGDF
jgi:hypothetical protein